MFDNLSIDLYSINIYSVIFRLFLAILIGGIIGTERDYKNRAAGLRTHILVSLGAAVVMMTNQYIFEMYPDADLDITRMGAQVVSGIGFLGAGTILVTSNNQVKGLTTAAGLWAAATIGLAIGIGFYEMAILGGIAIVAIVILLAPLKDFIQERAEAGELTLIIYTTNGFDDFLDFTSQQDVKITDMNVVDDFEDQQEHITILKVAFEIDNEVNIEEFITKIKELDEVNHVIKI